MQKSRNAYVRLCIWCQDEAVIKNRILSMSNSRCVKNAWFLHTLFEKGMPRY